MPSSPEEDERGRRLWRRKARSLDLGSDSRERRKAAAWMWHMHTQSTSVKNESLVQYAQIRQASDAWESIKRRSCSSCDHKDSRFRQEAVNVSSGPPNILIKEASQLLQQPSGVWDCGSTLYDTFELVSLSNRLDRSLLGFPARNFHVSPLHQYARLLRTLSLPRTLISLHSSPPPHNNFEIAAASFNGNASVQGLVAATKSKSSCASAKWLAKSAKKVVNYHGQMWCFKPFLEQVEEKPVEPSATVLNGNEGGSMSEAHEQERKQEWHRGR